MHHQKVDSDINILKSLPNPMALSGKTKCQSIDDVAQVPDLMQLHKPH